MQKQGWFQYIDELMVFLNRWSRLGILSFVFVLLFLVRTEFGLRVYESVPLLGTPWILCLVITMARIIITNPKFKQKANKFVQPFLVLRSRYTKTVDRIPN